MSVPERFGPVRSPESLAEGAYRAIEEKIVTLELAPGAVVTEQALGEMLGIGRTPVREALVRLKQDHLVTVLPRQGIRVEPLDTVHTLMAIELRHMVEALIVQRATRLSNEVERRRFRRLADTIEGAAEARDLIAFMRADRAFNDLVAQCAQHPVAARVVAPLHAVTRRLGYVFALRSGRGLDRTGPGHAGLMRAIADGDGAAAQAALESLLAMSRDIAMTIEEEGMLDPLALESDAGSAR